MFLLKGEPEPVATWAHRGQVPVHIVPLQGWTAVLPAGPSHAMAPYDDTLKMLAGRPVPSRLRSAIGLFSVGGNAVISAHLAGWRATQRWFVWSPGEGVVQPRQLETGRPADLVAAAGIHRKGARRSVRDILLDGAGDAASCLGDLLAALALPGSELLGGGEDPVAVPGSTMVEPGEEHLARFEKIISDEARHRAELEED
ncbi:MAG: hypothetical protein QOE58_795 [Actinomycetota bacterium]|jgi:hypothetical protein|nr:hypothetical protein [Actinomycetota bacterium]